MADSRRRTLRELDDLVADLDRLTANLNAIRQSRYAGSMAGIVRWLLPKVAEERCAAADRAKLLRAKGA